MIGALTWPRSRPLALTSAKLPAWLLPIFVALAGAVSVLHPAYDPDVGWHLRAGQIILATHAPSSYDTFSSTMTGAPWADFEWLWEATLAGIYAAGGLVGAVIWNSLIEAAILLLVAAGLRARGSSWLVAAGGALLTLANLFVYAEVRPGMTGALLIALFILVLETSQRRRDIRWLALLVPIQLIWANTHGSYVLGLVLCLTYGAAAMWERRSRRILVTWGGLGMALLATCLVNPMGAGLLRFTLGASHMSFNRDHNGEWVAPNFHATWAIPLLVSILLSLGLPLLFRSVRPTKREALLLVGATLAVMESNQFIPLYAVAAAPIVARMAEQALARPLPTRLPAIAGIVMAIELVAVGGYAVNGLQPAAYRASITGMYPADAVAYIEANHLRGPLFNQFGWGCYLITELPRLPVFVDGRTEMYGNAFLERYSAVMDGVEPAGIVLAEYGINLVLIPPKTALATELRLMPGWSEVYDDALAAVFIRQADASLA